MCILLLSGCGPSSGGHNKSPAQGNPAPNLQRFSDLVHLKGSLTYKAHIKTTVHLTQTTAADGPKKGYTLPKKRLSMEEDLTLTMDPRGNIHGRRDLSSGDGVEFTVQGQQMCVRLRYQKYLCHPYVPEEAQSRVKQIYGTFSGIMGLIAPFTLISDPK
ncbi:hypothetical protein KJ865_01475, partial [Myxococcota bacterium]|nr:hypothetical protein [Myxococcota bacterium]